MLLSTCVVYKGNVKIENFLSSFVDRSERCRVAFEGILREEIRNRIRAIGFKPRNDSFTSLGIDTFLKREKKEREKERRRAKKKKRLHSQETYTHARAYFCFSVMAIRAMYTVIRYSGAFSIFPSQ